MIAKILSLTPRVFPSSAFSTLASPPSPLRRDEDNDGGGACIVEDERLGWTANPSINGERAASAAAAATAAAFRRRPTPRRHVVPPRRRPRRSLSSSSTASASASSRRRRCRWRHCAALSSLSSLVLSLRCASWLLRVASLSPYRLALPSPPLVAPAGCCVSRRICRPILSRRLLVISSCQLVVACRKPLSPYLFGCTALLPSRRAG